MSLVRLYINNRWELDADSRRGVNGIDVEKKQFVFRLLREDLEKFQKQEDRTESQRKDNWTDIYQIIGFYNVFQGVLFQGVTQLATQRGCRFSIIPIILSVFVSLVTIIGVLFKASMLQGLARKLEGDRLQYKVTQSFISACEREGLNFDFETNGDADVIEENYNRMSFDFDKGMVECMKHTILLLLLLSIPSILFAWLIYLTMCGKYI